jgi:hypothetical protein
MVLGCIRRNWRDLAIAMKVAEVNKWGPNHVDTLTSGKRSTGSRHAILLGRLMRERAEPYRYNLNVNPFAQSFAAGRLEITRSVDASDVIKRRRHCDSHDAVRRNRLGCWT